jgi:hypothetical protein
MQHPFINDLSDKSLDELQSAINGLTTKLTFAYRTQNGALIHQLHMVMDSYRAEYNKRMDELLNKQKDQNKINIQKEN